MSMFDDFPVVATYTEDQAIEDGVLVHPYPTRFPWLLLTIAVHVECERVAKDRYGSADEYSKVVMPLIMDAVMAVRASREKDPPIVLEHTAAGTIWIFPNAKGGMTIMLPSDY
jgi:hypothetical protein